MDDEPTAEQLDLLRLISHAGGYIDHAADPPLADACVDREWLTPEGRTGYALTLDGHATLRRHPGADRR